MNKKKTTNEERLLGPGKLVSCDINAYSTVVDNSTLASAAAFPSQFMLLSEDIVSCDWHSLLIRLINEKPTNTYDLEKTKPSQNSHIVTGRLLLFFLPDSVRTSSWVLWYSKCNTALRSSISAPKTR